MYSKLMNCFSNKNLGLFIIRVGIAIVFGFAGYMKLAHADQMFAFFVSLGLPAFMVYVIGALEVLGAVSMLIGYMTKIMGFVLAVILVFAIILVKAKMGFVAAELDIITLAAALGVALVGPGAWSVHGGNCDDCKGGVCAVQ